MDIYIPPIPSPAIEAFAFAAMVAGFWRGGRDGRIFASLVLYQVVRVYAGRASPDLLAIFQSPSFHGLEGLAMLAFGLAAVLRARAYWTIWAAAAVVLGLVTDLLRMSIGLGAWAYYSAQITWFLVLCASVLAGSLQRRRSAAGTCAHVH
jgi:hypothetical protein